MRREREEKLSEEGEGGEVGRERDRKERDLETKGKG